MCVYVTLRSSLASCQLSFSFIGDLVMYFFSWGTIGGPGSLVADQT